MKTPIPFSAVLVALLATRAAGAAHDENASAAASDPDRYNVAWDSPSKDRSGSMPSGTAISPSTLGRTQWRFAVLYRQVRACSENRQLLKLGRIRVKFSPIPFAKGSPFKQELRLRHGEIVITAGQEAPIEVRLWVDANRPVIELEASGANRSNAGPYGAMAQ